MKLFPSEPVKTALRSKPDDPLHFFRLAPAEALPSPDMAGAAFAVSARWLLHAKPGMLSGYPPGLYASITYELPNLAREVLPEGVGEEIAAHLEQT